MALATHLQGDGEASPSVGLDVGTTNSAVAVRRADGRFVVIPPPGQNGSNCRPTLHDKKHCDLTWSCILINPLGLFENVLHFKKKQRKKQVYDKHPKTANLATVQNYARRMQWKGNNETKQ